MNADNFSLTIHFQFDSIRWRTAAGVVAPGGTILVTWSVVPDPIDGGMPDEVRVPFSDALCSLGTVVFAGDGGCLFRARTADQLGPAFDTGWAMNAQWLTLVDRDAAGDPDIDRFVRLLYERWTLPSAWPGGVKIVVQPGVDGDAAACHCRDVAAKAALVDAIRRSTEKCGTQLIIQQVGSQAPIF